MSNRLHRFAITLLVAIGGAAAMLARHDVVQAAPPQMVRWEILATVTNVNDPLGLFPDIRLGDPVRGMLKYDVSLFPNPLFSSTYEHYFTNDEWVDVARMVIENPRNGSEFAFQTDIDGEYADIDVFNDYPGANGAFDGFLAQQSVIAPAGYLGPSPVVAVVLEGPPGIFPGAAHFPTIEDQPPSQLNLDDWPIAGMAFWDAYAEDPSATGIEAEIYSMTPVMEPHRSGDYDYDGDVDTDDYVGWRIEYGDRILQYTDGNGDGITDAADYTVWRDNLGGGSLVNRGVGVTGPVGAADYNIWKANFGQSPGGGSGPAGYPLGASAVPEPVAVLLALVAWGLCLARFSRRAINRNRSTPRLVGSGVAASESH